MQPRCARAARVSAIGSDTVSVAGAAVGGSGGVGVAFAVLAANCSTVRVPLGSGAPVGSVSAGNPALARASFTVTTLAMSVGASAIDGAVPLDAGGSSTCEI